MEKGHGHLAMPLFAGVIFNGGWMQPIGYRWINMRI